MSTYLALSTTVTSVWIGANDIATEGEWRWPDGAPLGYINWTSGEPNDFDGNEDCGEIKASKGEPVWNDVPCSRELHFVCEGY